MIILDNVSIKYGSHLLLNSIDIYCMSWEITILQWPNWSWKTSVLKSIMFNNIIHKWKIVLAWKNNSWNIYTNKEMFWYLPQDNLLFEHLSCYENIKLPFLNYWNNCKSDQINYYLNYFDLDNIKNKFPHEISLWQKQLIAFIRTILIDSPYLLLDEPSSALDLNNIAKIKKVLWDVKKQNKTIVIISHDIWFIDKLWDKSYYIWWWVVKKK